MNLLAVSKHIKILLCCSALNIVGCTSGNHPESSSKVQSFAKNLQITDEEVSFVGMCDASGAVPLSDTQFAIADDEDNILRVYNAFEGGPPLLSNDISESFNLYPKPRKNPQKPPKPPEEMDIEAATRIDNTAYWLTSHGRNRTGKFKAARYYFFATSLVTSDASLKIIGSTHVDLIQTLFSDERYKPFKLDLAAEKPPKDKGGFNIEGMTAKHEGGVWIGLRNPLIDNKALLFSLKNAVQVIEGEEPLFGEPLLLDLHGRGVRALSSWKGFYLIVAGSYDGSGKSALYVWDGKSNDVYLVDEFMASEFNPEAFFTPENLNRFLLISDDGSQMVGEVPCKDLADVVKKGFRARWVTIDL